MRREYWIIRDTSKSAPSGFAGYLKSEGIWTTVRKEAHPFLSAATARLAAKVYAHGTWRLIHVTVKPKPCIMCAKRVSERDRAVATVQSEIDATFHLIEENKIDEDTGHQVLDILDRVRKRIIGENGKG